MQGGYLDWTGSRTLRSPPILAGYPLADAVASFECDEPPAGGSIEMLGGGQVYQRSPAHRWAPLALGAARYSLLLEAVAEEDHHRLLRLVSTARAEPVPVWLEDPREDVWTIPAQPKTR